LVLDYSRDHHRPGRRLPYFPPVTCRSRLMLEVASELVGVRGWIDRQAKVSLRPQGGEQWNLTLFGSDTPSAIGAVVRGDAHIAMINPMGPLAMAYRGSAPFGEPQPLRVVTMMPSQDQLVFAVKADTGIQSVADIGERRYPLRVSMRGQRDHSIHFMVEQVFQAAGFSLDDIVAWGGLVRYDHNLPDDPNRMGAVDRGEIDAIFDEAVEVWSDMAVEHGMRLLPVEESLLQKMEALGLRRAAIRAENHPTLREDVWTVDFSGWPVFTRADMPDNVVKLFCQCLEARKDLVPWERDGPLPLEIMCRESDETPLDVPLHPAAEQFWRERGYLG
jgi:TRAP-type uncharacterized transport system substrate-binding protein